ncbi:MAG: hypothetical protein DRG11_02105 [Epsilonproteobacteria bacterium]|nr:MAG: hypothetical protein DRG11_02105 [Campylobacterota bacterium]
MLKDIDGYKFELKFHTSNKIRRTTVVLNSQKLVTIKAPINYSDKQFEKIYQKFIPWIGKHIKKAKPTHMFDFLSNRDIKFLGKTHKAKLVENSFIDDICITLKNENIVVSYNKKYHSSNEVFFYALKQFYNKNSQKIIDEIFSNFIKKTGFNPTGINYKYFKSKWGSCSSEDKISINIMLLQFDIDVISYVVLHELCHIKEKNHSKKFWLLLSYHMPFYKQHKQKLKKGLI